MATRKASSQTEQASEVKSDNTLNKNPEDSATARVAELELMVQQLMAKLEEKNNTPIQVVSAPTGMDAQCTLVHLIECASGLPTSITLSDGTPFSFTRFGERRLFRFYQMQDIVSRYRSWFERGIFALGEDCEAYELDFGMKATPLPFTPEKFEQMNRMSNEEFDSFIKSLTPVQRAHIGHTWMKRYSEKQYGYDNVDKVKIINKHTDGLLKPILKDLLDEE